MMLRAAKVPDAPDHLLDAEKHTPRHAQNQSANPANEGSIIALEGQKSDCFPCQTVIHM